MKYQVLLHDLSNNSYTVVGDNLELAKALGILNAIVPVGAHIKTVEFVIREI